MILVSQYPGCALSERSVDMPRDRISIQNFLRSGEIFIHEHNNYSDSEQTVLRAMLGRLDAKVNKDNDTKGSGDD